jgi:hypothetical protein
MAASGTTKKISINNVLGCSGTATLASATITGNLTVDTNTLFVDSSADKVGIGTTSLSNEKLTVAGNISANAWLGRSNISVPAGDCSIFRSADNTLGFGIASTTAMTLNSTGLGVGVSPAAKFDSLVADAAECARFRAASGWLRIHPYLDATDVCRLQSVNNTNTGLQNLTVEGFNLRFNTNNGNAVIIDSLGNTVSNVNSAVPALGTNNRMVFNLTSNTNLRISVRGSDGVTRTTNLTLT